MGDSECSCAQNDHSESKRINHTKLVTYWEHHQGASTGSTWFPAAAAGSADFVARQLPDSSAYLAAPPPLGLLALPVIQPEIQPTNTLLEKQFHRFR